MTIAPFISDKELISFARRFLRDRLGPFRADVAICLTPNKNGHRAEFPALITCIGFAELLSSLYAGNLESNGLANLKNYAVRFMDTTKYDPVRLEILYFLFRHKLAHLSFPHSVFDTASRSQLRHQKHRRITWSVYSGKRRLPIELDDHAVKHLKKALRPWPISYDCRALISVRSLQTDIVKSIYGPSGYLACLKAELIAREHFAKCMRAMFPP
jgi:hypothetical protein